MSSLRSKDLPVPDSALVIAAHPDDAEFQCGATLAKWSAQGCVVHHLILTDGSKGTWDPEADVTQLVAERQEEQRAAAKALGATGQVVFLGITDGELQSGLWERSQVAYWIRHLRPSVVLGHDPWRRYRLHPDHRHAGWLAVDGVVAARDPHFHPEHGVPHHRPQALLLFEADEPDHVEDVCGFAEAKIAALLAHKSQYRSTMFIEPTDDGAQLEAFRQRIFARLREHAALANPPVEQGEAFKILTDL
ncbi:MAG: PIG-L family deacetylase [Acidimicrobiales bacterium]|nr:PIG-L family deacetylase [Acidimicrobiales bacterium]